PVASRVSRDAAVTVPGTRAWDQRVARAWAMRSPAFPSQPSGRRDAAVRLTERTAAASAAGSGTSRLVPSVIVMGRSVFSRTVRQGTPRAVVSSWRPPESVTTTWAPCTRSGISEALLRARMRGEHHRIVARQVAQRVRDPREAARIVDVGRPVQGDHDSPAVHA